MPNKNQAYNAFDFKELFSFEELNFATIDSITASRGYEVFAWGIHLDSVRQYHSVIKTYQTKHLKKNKKQKIAREISVRKICFEYDSITQKCREDWVLVWQNPIRIVCNSLEEYNGYKTQFLQDFKDFKLVKEEQGRGMCMPFYLDIQIYENIKYSITFSRFCDKERRTPKGIFYAKCRFCEIEISYRMDFLNKR